MSSHDTVLPPANQGADCESATILRQAASLVLNTLDLCREPADAVLADPATQRRRGRPLQLPWTQLWGSLLLCTLGGMGSFADWRRFLGTESVGDFPHVWLSTNALVKRLLQAGLSPLEDLWALFNDRLAGELAPCTLAPFASQLLCLDETKLDRLARHLKPLRHLPSADPALFAGKLLGLFDLRAEAVAVAGMAREDGR